MLTGITGRSASGWSVASCEGRKIFAVVGSLGRGAVGGAFVEILRTMLRAEGGGATVRRGGSVGSGCDVGLFVTRSAEGGDGAAGRRVSGAGPAGCEERHCLGTGSLGDLLVRVVSVAGCRMKDCVESGLDTDCCAR